MLGIANNPGGRHQKLKLHTLLHGFANFHVLRRHFRLRTPIQHINLLRAQTHRRATSVHSRIAAADHSHPATQLAQITQRHIAQKVYATDHARQILALTAQSGAAPGAVGQINCVKIALQIRELNISTQHTFGANFHAQSHD